MLQLLKPPTHLRDEDRRLWLGAKLRRLAKKIENAMGPEAAAQELEQILFEANRLLDVAAIPGMNQC